MGLTNGIFFEVQGGVGNDANGGGFLPGATGTDYSQQASPQFALTGIATAGAGAVFLTALAASTMVGNVLKVVSGTNFTVGRYIVTSVSVGVSVTVDRNLTTGVGASGVINIGGAVNTIGELATTIGSIVNVGQYNIYVKAATYTLTSGISPASIGSGTVIRFIGYTTTRGDNGKATITTATNSITLFSLPSNSAGYGFYNFTMTNTASIRAGAISAGGTYNGLIIVNCLFDGFTRAIDVGATYGTFIHKVEIKNSTTGGIRISSGNNISSTSITESWIHDTTGIGVEINGTGVAILSRTAITSSSGDGLGTAAGDQGAGGKIFTILNCAFVSNADGIDLAQGSGVPVTLNVSDSVFYGNSGYGIRSTTLLCANILRTNAFGGNNGGGTGLNILNVTLAGDEVTLTGNPFTSSTTGDFTLNSTAGAGAACKAVGTPTSIP